MLRPAGISQIMTDRSVAGLCQTTGKQGLRKVGLGSVSLELRSTCSAIDCASMSLVGREGSL